MNCPKCKSDKTRVGQLNNSEVLCLTCGSVFDSYQKKPTTKEITTAAAEYMRGQDCHIQSGLKTWQMLKLVDENPEAKVMPQFGEGPQPNGFEKLESWSMDKCLNCKWSALIPPKKVTITRKDLFDAIDRADKCKKDIAASFGYWIAEELGLQ